MKKLSIIMVSVLLLSFTTAYSDGFFQDYKNVQNISGSVHTVGKSEVVYSDEQKAVVLKAAVQDNSDSPPHTEPCPKWILTRKGSIFMLRTP